MDIDQYLKAMEPRYKEAKEFSNVYEAAVASQAQLGEANVNQGKLYNAAVEKGYKGVSREAAVLAAIAAAPDLRAVVPEEAEDVSDSDPEG